jgi:hypothetical protein
MLCSTCSEVIKPVVAIDLDGTLGDYHGHFIRFASEWTGQGIESTLRASLSPYRGNTHFSTYCCMIFDITIEVYRSIKLAYRQAGMKRSMPIIDGARDICSMVYREGAELWVTTTRPYLSLDSIVPDTREWLDRHQIGFDHMLFDADKYDVLADRVDSGRVVAVLDDLPEMYDAAAKNFGTEVPILITGQFNKAVRRTNMAPLKHSTAIVRERIIDWKVNND